MPRESLKSEHGERSPDRRRKDRKRETKSHHKHHYDDHSRHSKHPKLESEDRSTHHRRDSIDMSQIRVKKESDESSRSESRHSFDHHMIKVKSEPEERKLGHQHHRSSHRHSEHHGHRRSSPHRDTRQSENFRNHSIKKEDEDWTNRPRRNNNQLNRRRGNRRQEEDDSQYTFGRPGDDTEENATTQDKSKPDFKTSGKLAEDTNTFKGVVIKYNEPEEARKPRTRWRLYAFKGEKELPMLPIHRQSAYLLGRDRQVADIPIDHPSCSKQQAVLQYRLVDYERDDGLRGRRVRPYIIDLESSNGTFVNNKKIESRRYVELLEKDVIKFGFSSREYVILHENSKVDEDSDEDTGVD